MAGKISLSSIRQQITKKIENSWLGTTRFGRWLVSTIRPKEARRQIPAPDDKSSRPSAATLSERTASSYNSAYSIQTPDTSPEPDSGLPTPEEPHFKNEAPDQKPQHLQHASPQVKRFASRIQQNFQPQVHYRSYSSAALQSTDAQLATLLDGTRPLAIIIDQNDISAFEQALQGQTNLAYERVPDIDNSGYKLLVWRTGDRRSPKIAQRYKELISRWQGHFHKNRLAGSPPNEARLRADVRIRNRLLILEGVNKTERSERLRAAKASLASSMADSVPRKTQGTPLYANKSIRGLMADKRIRERLINPQQLLDAVRTKKPGDISSQQTHLQQTLALYQQKLTQGIPNHTGMIETKGSELIDHLEVMITILDEQITKQPSQSLNRQKLLLSHERLLLLQVMNDPGTHELNGSLNWKEAIEFKRSGYNLDPSVTRITFRQENLNPGKPVTTLGNGAYNTVYSAQYDTKDGAYDGVIKPEPAYDDSVWDAIVGQDQYLDKSTPHFTLRNIGTRIVDQHLGLSLMPNVCFAMHNDKLSMVMDKAPGNTGGDKRDDGKKKLGHMLRKQQISEPTKNTIAKNLSNLEWEDALLAQPDRHPNNIMIDYQTGKVTGIDNDTCLYPYHGIIDRSEEDGYFLFPKGCRVGLPTLISREMKQQLEQLDIDALCQDLEEQADLNAEEQEALRTRHDLLLAHARDLQQKGLVADDWSTWRSPDGTQDAREYQLNMTKKPGYNTTRAAYNRYLSNSQTYSTWQNGGKPGWQPPATLLDELIQDRKILLQNPQYINSSYLAMCAS